MRVLVTGANGFVGSAVCRYLLSSGLNVRAAVRNESISNVPGRGGASWETFVSGNIGPSTEWQQSLTGVDVVIHAAARVHVMRERSSDPLTEFRAVNTAGTERLAREAARCGAQRIVYLSSIKVNGENTRPSTPFRETDLPSPQDPYAVSKCEAEAALRRVGEQTGLEVVIVRPPLVYGPRVKGNIATMLSWAYRGIPLPLAAISNARSLVALENLCSFLHSCTIKPAAAGETFLAGDTNALSTAELFRMLSAGMGKQARLYSVSEPLLKVAFACCGLHRIYRRLCQSLVVDTQKAADRLGWCAPVEAQRALEQTGEWYVKSRRRSAGKG